MNMYQTVMGSAMVKNIKVGRRKYRILKGNLHSEVRLMEPELAPERKPKGTKSKRRESETGNLPRQQGCWWMEGAARLVWLYRVSRESAGNEMKWQGVEGVCLDVSWVQAGLYPISRCDFPRIFLAPLWEQTTMKQGRKQEGLLVAWTRGQQ